MKLAIIYSKTKLSGKLTKFWTGSYAYHCGFVDMESDTFYDMHLLPRKSSWKELNYKDVQMFEVNLNAVDCEHYLKSYSHMVYGWKDYLLFALRPFYHLLGKSTRNANGWICSEMCNAWLWEKNIQSTPFDPKLAPPSPADLDEFFKVMNTL